MDLPTESSFLIIKVSDFDKNPAVPVLRGGFLVIKMIEDNLRGDYVDQLSPNR